MFGIVDVGGVTMFETVDIGGVVVNNCAAALVNGGVEDVRFVTLFVEITFDALVLRGMCGTDVERVNDLGVKALRTRVKRPTLGVDDTVTAG